MSSRLPSALQDKDGPGPMGSMGGVHVEKEVKLDGIVKSHERAQHGGAGFATTGSIAVEKEDVSHGIIRAGGAPIYTGPTFQNSGSLATEKDKISHGIIRGDAKAVEGPIDASSGDINALITERNALRGLPDGEAKARAWMEAVLKEKFPEETLHEALKTGVRFCQALNAVFPNTISKINDSKITYMQLENIGNYTKACHRIGFNKSLIFETTDFSENRNMTLVIDNLLHLGKLAKRKHLHDIVLEDPVAAA